MSVMREQCSSILYTKSLRLVFKKLSMQWYSEDTIMENTQISDEEPNSEQDVFDFDKYNHNVNPLDFTTRQSWKRKASKVVIQQDTIPTLLNIQSQDVEEDDFDMEFTL